MASPQGSNQLQKKYRDQWAGGTNYYAGIRQVKDNESPLSTNVDFQGTGSVGNRQGYTEIGTVTNARTQIFGMNEFHTNTTNNLIKFASDGSTIQLGYSLGGAWTFDSSFSFTDQINIDSVQANSLLYSFNGVNIMKQWDGVSWTSTTNGKILKYGAYYNNRIWGVDPANQDTLYWSKSSTADFTSTGSGNIQIFPGSGAVITAIHTFQNSLYAFLNGPIKGIFRLDPDPAVANNFTLTMITNTIGCVSHRSVAQVENDMYFASDDGIYTLGAVAYFTNIRTTNKSLRMQPIFDALSGTSKQKLVGKYFNFKYHLFYPLFGGNNDSVLVYDIRYQGMQDWRNIGAQDASTFTDATKKTTFYFGSPITGKIFKLYSGSTDNGSLITSYWTSKSYDESLSDTEKLYFDTTFIFAGVNGAITLSVVFNDSQITTTKTLTQQNPQGGFGFSAFGRDRFGGNKNKILVVQISTQPQRIKVKGQKFAIQYTISSTGSWSLNMITQTFQVFSHYKFPSNLKVN